MISLTLQYRFSTTVITPVRITHHYDFPQYKTLVSCTIASMTKRDFVGKTTVANKVWSAEGGQWLEKTHLRWWVSTNVLNPDVIGRCWQVGPPFSCAGSKTTASLPPSPWEALTSSAPSLQGNCSTAFIHPFVSHLPGFLTFFSTLWLPSSITITNQPTIFLMQNCFWSQCSSCKLHLARKQQ